MNTIFTDRTESLIILLSQKLNINPINNPKRGPPKAILTKLTTTPKNDEDFPFAKSINRAKNTIAVPSFIKDYPSIKVLNLTLAPNSLSNATTATGSVAESTQPSVKASYQFN